MTASPRRALARALLCAACAVAVYAAARPAPASAFTLLTLDNGRTLVKWPGGVVSFELNLNLIPTLEDDLDAILSGVSTWTSLTCADTTVTYDGTTPASGASYTGGFDGVNRVVYVAAQNWRAEDSSALAVTTFNFSRTQLAEADISFNGSYGWSTTGQGGRYDVQAVATHELGHFFGILHTQDLSATMYPSTGAAELGPRTLAPDDEQAFCLLYPASGTYTCDATHKCPQVNYYDEFGRDRALGQMRCVDGACVLGDSAPSLGFGDLCQDSTQCAEGLTCAESGGERRCTQACTLGQAGGCPQGFQCVTGGFFSEDGLCWAAAQGTTPIGGECLFSSDCEGGLCVLDPSRADEGVGLCSALCREDASSCPQGTLCLPISIPGRSACLPTGDGAPGEPCESFMECQGGLCLRDGQGTACRAPCDADQPQSGCDAGTACLRTLYGDACLGVGASPPGTPCAEAFDCDTLLCLPSIGAQGEALCSARCDQADPCAQGLTCQFFGAGQQFCVPSAGGDDTSSPDAGDASSPDAGDASSPDAGDADPTADAPGAHLTEGSDGECGCRVRASGLRAARGGWWLVIAACAAGWAARPRRRARARVS